MRKMNTNPTLFKATIPNVDLPGTDEGYWFYGLERDAIYELRYGPYANDPEWDYGTVLIDTHIWHATFGTIVSDAYWGYEWPVTISWSSNSRILKVQGHWEDRVEEVLEWKLELWRVA